MYLTQGFHRSVQQDPHSVMTIFGDRRRTFAEVADRVARLAGGLHRLGVGRGDRVAVLALNSDRYSELVLAVAWADAVIVPVNTRWSTEEIASSLADSSTAALVVDDAFAGLVPELRQRCPQLARVVDASEGRVLDDGTGYEELVASSAPIDDARRGGDQLAGLFYTGGTTGSPKGVMLSHANLVTSALGNAASRWLLRPGGVYLHAAPMFHLADLAVWLVALEIGASHVVVPSFAPTAVMEAIERHQVTDVMLVPTMVQAIVDHPSVRTYDLASLRSVLYGASPIPVALLERAMTALPSAGFVQAYGMTELSPTATLLGPGDHHGRFLESAGRAAPHAEIRIVDDQDREVPRGTIGEVVVRGGHVMLGYWNRPEETATALRGGWMHTGDAATMDEAGYVYLVDRIKDMIVTGGENVYSAEVENAVARHPAVAQCAVIAVPDPDWGERVHAVVVLRPGATATAEDIRAHAKALIAGYKAPRSVEFVDSLPLSGAGKVLKRDLRRPYWAGRRRQVG